MPIFNALHFVKKKKNQLFEKEAPPPAKKDNFSFEKTIFRNMKGILKNA